MKNIFYIAVLLLTLSSCEKTFLGEDQVNSPENNFEIFWEDFDKHYGLFEARGWNWDSIYTVYRPQINAQTTDAELWNVCKDMITYLDDSHTFIYNPEGDDDNFYVSGSEEDDRVETEFSLDLIRSDYIENVVELFPKFTEQYEGVNFLYGKVKDKDIGYIYLSAIAAENEDFMDDVLADIGDHEAIILDVRNNSGGDDETAKEIAGRFATEKKLAYTVQERTGENHNDFAEKREYFSEPLGTQNYTKPVIFLTDKITVSAAEVLGSYMNSLDNVTQIGDVTAGDFSDVGMRRFLPNGWQYQYSIMMFLMPDGQSLDGVGHIPDISIVNSVEDIEAGNDKVMEGAIEYLFDEYGIE